MLDVENVKVHGVGRGFSVGGCCWFHHEISVVGDNQVAHTAETTAKPKLRVVELEVIGHRKYATVLQIQMKHWINCGAPGRAGVARQLAVWNCGFKRLGGDTCCDHSITASEHHIRVAVNMQSSGFIAKLVNDVHSDCSRVGDHGRVKCQASFAVQLKRGDLEQHLAISRDKRVKRAVQALVVQNQVVHIVGAISVDCSASTVCPATET